MTSLFASAVLLTLGTVKAAYWPTKVYDYSNDGALCDTSKEQYLQVETYDFHDHPRVQMTWRQLSGECGAAVSDPVEWTAVYDADAGDEGGTETGMVRLHLFVCCPFGEYELELVIESYSDAGSTLEQRTGWEIETGGVEYQIWDSIKSYLKDDENYSPTEPGTYTWPIAGEMGFYSTLYAGRLPPIECEVQVPSGTVRMGCYADSRNNRTFSQDKYVLGEKGADGMTPEICSDFCAEHDYFGLEYGQECYCGTEGEFEAVTSSSACGLTVQSLCTGDSTRQCGGFLALDVYQRTHTSASYESEGCYVDSKRNRLMSMSVTQEPMSAAICYQICNSAGYTHFGTQFGKECWCSTDPNLTANAPEAPSSECDMTCSGSSSELCGGYTRMSTYNITDPTSTYVGCYGDGRSPRAMPDAGMYTNMGMTNEMCQERCRDEGYAYAGSQFSTECWCSDTYDAYGMSAGGCTYECAGDTSQMCGGRFALSVYGT